MSVSSLSQPWWWSSLTKVYSLQYLSILCPPSSCCSAMLAWMRKMGNCLKSTTADDISLLTDSNTNNSNSIEQLEQPPPYVQVVLVSVVVNAVVNNTDFPLFRRRPTAPSLRSLRSSIRPPTCPAQPVSSPRRSRSRSPSESASFSICPQEPSMAARRTESESWSPPSIMLIFTINISSLPGVSSVWLSSTWATVWGTCPACTPTTWSASTTGWWGASPAPAVWSQWTLLC